MAWISFGTLPCRKKINLITARVSMLLKSRGRPWHASELFSFLVRLSTYQHPGNMGWWHELNDNDHNVLSSNQVCYLDEQMQNTDGAKKMYTHLHRQHLLKCVYIFWHHLYINNTVCTVKHSDMFRCSEIIFRKSFPIHSEVTKSVKLRNQ